MPAIPVKPEYGPTLGGLLSPRWRAATPLGRRLVTAAGIVLVALLAWLVLALEPAGYSHGGSVPFGFKYKGLWRTAPDPGGLVKVVDPSGAGRLKFSFAVAPETLPPYSGDILGEVPLFAYGYAQQLARYYPLYEPRGEGKTKINKALAYEVLFTTVLGGHTLNGRAVLMFPERAGAREGVSIVMLARPSRSEITPTEVASEGVLLRPLKTFAFG